MSKINWNQAKKYKDITYKKQVVLLELHLTDQMLEMLLDLKQLLNYMMHYMMLKKTLQ